MKKTLLSVLASGIVLLASGQNPTPPKEVQDAFTKKFSTAQKVEWEQEDNEWEAEFVMNNNEYTSCFDATGKWLETEMEVKKKDLPAEVYKAIAQQFDGFEIEEIESVEKPDFKGYEIELEKEDTKVDVVCTPDGKLTIQKVKVDDDDEDEEHNDKD